MTDNTDICPHCGKSLVEQETFKIGDYVKAVAVRASVFQDNVYMIIYIEGRRNADNVHEDVCALVDVLSGTRRADPFVVSEVSKITKDEMNSSAAGRFRAEYTKLSHAEVAKYLVKEGN